MIDARPSALGRLHLGARAAFYRPVSTTELDKPTKDPVDPADDAGSLYVDAATRVSNPSRFDEWYYGIEDKLGQGTVGMAVCLIMFIVILLIAIFFKPI
jgi:hypothetical protein